VPQDCDDYVHRVGRTGRMGRDGIAFTFVVPGEGGILTSIEQRINRELIRDSIEGFDPTPSGTALAAAAVAAEAEPEEGAAAESRKRLNPMNRRITRRRR